jgi:hypothetical protein
MCFTASKRKTHIGKNTRIQGTDGALKNRFSAAFMRRWRNGTEKKALAPV